MLIGLFFFFLFMGIPIVFSMALSALAVIVIDDLPLLIIIQRLFAGSDSFILTAIPFFILAGSLMSAGGITIRLIEFSQALIGHIRGGLALVNILASMIFGGVSGSATADTAAIGGILIPAMEKEGYHRDFSGAVTAASATLGIVIPPSIPMILFGVVAGESIGRLFLGGFIPGIMVAVGMMIPTYFISKKRNYPKHARVTLGQLIKSFWRSFWALAMPVFIVGSIVAGIVTPTEAGVLAVFYAAFVGFAVYGELQIADLPKIMRNTVSTTASVMIIMAVASIFSWVLANMEIPQQIAEAIWSTTHNKYVILLLINVFLLIIGTFVDLGPAIIITVPILMPLVKLVGIDPVHFGLIVTVNLGIGLFTPPVGTNLYICCSVAKISLEKISRAELPYILFSILILMIITYFPITVLLIPDLFMH